MRWRTKVAEWLAPNEFRELRGLRADLEAAKQVMAQRVNLSQRVASGFENSAQSANAQAERLYAMVYDRLTREEKKQLNMGLPS